MFHDQLDFVSVHEKLLDNLKSVLNPKQKPSLDAQLDVIVHEKAGDLKNQKAFLTVCFLHSFRDKYVADSLGCRFSACRFDAC